MTTPTYQGSIHFLRLQFEACLEPWMREEFPDLTDLQVLKNHTRYMEEDEIHQALAHILNVLATCPNLANLEADLQEAGVYSVTDEQGAAWLCRWACLLSEWLILRRDREAWDWASIEW